VLPKSVKSSKLDIKRGCYPADIGIALNEAYMKFFSRLVLASALALSLAIGGVLALTTMGAEAKSSVVWCGSPGNCTPYPYRTYGGRESVCAKNSPCYLSPACTGDQVCESHRPPNAN